MTAFNYFYRCPTCNNEWEDEWTSIDDNDCVQCGTLHISPYKSEKALLDESDLGPEPPSEDLQAWMEWTLKCGIIRFRYQEDAIETMAYYDMVSTLRQTIGLEKAEAFINQAVHQPERDTTIVWIRNWRRWSKTEETIDAEQPREE